jgi:ATP synthase protein I
MEKSTREKHQEDIGRRVGRREARKIRARKEKDKDVWFGLGMFGLVGWSVAIPTVIGVALGVWIDTRWPSRYSWTLTLLILGIGLGCFNAWFWITKERKSIERKDRDD